MKAKILTRETIRELGMSDRNFPQFEVGDAIAVSQWIVEASDEKLKKGAKASDKPASKKRLQVFEGDVIAMRNNGASSTFTVRKIASCAIAVERIFPYYSPIIESIQIVHKGDVRRAKLYYVRNRIGKAARIAERILTKEEKKQQAEKKSK